MGGYLVPVPEKVDAALVIGHRLLGPCPGGPEDVPQALLGASRPDHADERLTYGRQGEFVVGWAGIKPSRTRDTHKSGIMCAGWVDRLEVADESLPEHARSSLTGQRRAVELLEQRVDKVDL
jgi:hypothetical protein